jgi:hypothetical protein
MEPAPQADVMLPDLPPPELQQGEAETGGEEQVEAPDAAPADGAGKHLSVPGWLSRSACYMLKTFVFAGAQLPPTEEAVGTSGRPSELLMTGSGYQDVIAIDLVDDPLLTDNNIENFKKAYDFVMVRSE